MHVFHCTVWRLKGVGSSFKVVRSNARLRAWLRHVTDMFSKHHLPNYKWISLYIPKVLVYVLIQKCHSLAWEVLGTLSMLSKIRSQSYKASFLLRSCFRWWKLNYALVNPSLCKDLFSERSATQTMAGHPVRQPTATRGRLQDFSTHLFAGTDSQAIFSAIDKLSYQPLSGV